ncbi:Uma2 family endonuclease [uncultured Lamprocystis sp.]|jgi:Uma2 family endonuclease|uniref:Uma2 family endonuclease n=1 Tax=uncultured Lamprocystis sp. TaxID=543132 RepID=UPI0025D119C2|nr:Uma2 family endonuclease [uncultured Lamprocystis sp.]
MISVAAYLENEKVADLRSEYVNGLCLPVVGASRRHDQICMRLAQLLADHLNGSACRLFRPRVKVHLQGPADERFYYPDLHVACQEAAEHPDYLDTPRLIIEVLSAASAHRDRDEKAPAYCRMATLDELVLVADDAPRIEVRRRRDQWAPETLVDTGALDLISIGAVIPLEQIFGGLAPGGNKEPLT